MEPPGRRGRERARRRVSSPVRGVRTAGTLRRLFVPAIRRGEDRLGTRSREPRRSRALREQPHRVQKVVDLVVLRLAHRRRPPSSRPWHVLQSVSTCESGARAWSSPTARCAVRSWMERRRGSAHRPDRSLSSSCPGRCGPALAAALGREPALLALVVGRWAAAMADRDSPQASRADLETAVTHCRRPSSFRRKQIGETRLQYIARKNRMVEPKLLTSATTAP